MEPYIIKFQAPYDLMERGVSKIFGYVNIFSRYLAHMAKSLYTQGQIFNDNMLNLVEV